MQKNCLSLTSLLTCSESGGWRGTESGGKKAEERKRERRGMERVLSLSLSLSLSPPTPPCFFVTFFSLRHPHSLNAWNRSVLPVLPRARIVPWVPELHGLPLKQNKEHRFVSYLCLQTSSLFRVASGASR